MAYKNNFVVAVKNSGKILREAGGIVSIPFGSEYSLLLKNKNSSRAVVTVEIDGVVVLDGKALIIEPNETFDLIGFMSGTTIKNKFRFIEKTKQISRYRGDRVEDGLVRVEFKFEEPRTRLTPISKPYWTHGTFDGTPNNVSNIKYRSKYGNGASACCFSAPTASKTNDGITVKGSEVSQSFDFGIVGNLESESTVITLKLVGVDFITKSTINKVVTVNTKLVCSTCGKRSRSVAKFCSRCGTYIC